jgi:hypothetical protein
MSDTDFNVFLTQINKIQHTELTVYKADIMYERKHLYFYILLKVKKHSREWFNKNILTCSQNNPYTLVFE